MDLCSLPEEMLANVLKYSNYEDVTKMRKLNSYVDKVAKRNNINKLDADSLSLTNSSYQNGWLEISFGFNVPADIESFTDKFEIDANGRNVVHFVDKYLNKFRSVDSLVLHHLELHAYLLQILIKHKSLFRNEISIFGCTIHAEAADLAELLKGSKESEIEGNSWSILGGVNYGANDEIACNLIPVTKDLSFWCNTFSEVPFPGATDKTLKVLRINPMKFFSVYYCDIGATGKGVVKLAKKAFANGHEFEYTLGRVHVDSREEGRHYVKQLKSIEGVTVDVFESLGEFVCHILKGNSKKFSVDFIYDVPIYENVVNEQYNDFDI